VGRAIKEGEAIRDMIRTTSRWATFMTRSHRLGSVRGDSQSHGGVGALLQVGGRDPQSLKELSNSSKEQGKKQEAAAVLQASDLDLSRRRPGAQPVGKLTLDLGRLRFAEREYQAVLDLKPAIRRRAPGPGAGI